MSGRQIFSDAEKLCLQELIIKYKLNSMTTISAGNSSIKKRAWARLVEEYNSIESNIKRTESQLKKCWDNLKSRKKALLTLEKKERMKTGRGSFNPKPGPSAEDPMLVNEALLQTTDVEIKHVTDSDNLPQDTSQEILHTETGSHQIPPEKAVLNCEPGLLSQLYTMQEPTGSGTEQEKDHCVRSGSRITDYIASGQRTPGTAKNIRTKVIVDEFQIRKNNYGRIQERDEELHSLIIEEKKWLVKAAEEIYKRTVIERQNAQEILQCNEAKREVAELFK